MHPLDFETAISTVVRTLLIAALLAAAYALSLTLGYPAGEADFLLYESVPAIGENALATVCVALGGHLVSRYLTKREEQSKR